MGGKLCVSCAIESCGSFDGVVSHSVEIAYVFGSWLNAGPGSRPLSASIIDYWLSFAVSLDPNDGKGTERPQWPQYTPTNQVLLELNGNKTSVIPDGTFQLP